MSYVNADTDTAGLSRRSVLTGMATIAVASRVPGTHNGRGEDDLPPGVNIDVRLPGANVFSF